MIASTPALLQDAAEAELFIGRLLQLADQALAALAEDDIELALAAVDARDECLQRSAPPLARLVGRRARQAERGVGASELDRRCAELRNLASALQASEAELSLRLQARRDALAAELDRIGQGTAVTSAYQGAGEPARIDFRG